jgi:nicotinate-nucleotide--dimethylbenzimidazole phosphoribosyltransferase
MEIPTIAPLDEDCQRAAQARQDVLTKPAGALGRLEALSVRLAGMTGRLDWLPMNRLVAVCAADHGVAAQGLSAYPAEVTQQMVLNFLRGGAAINVLARQMNARVLVIDAGVAAEFEEHPALISAKIGWGTADFTSALP